MSSAPVISNPPIRVPFATQCVAWVVGLAASLVGMINLFAEWDPNLATIQFVILIIAPIVWMIESKRAIPAVTESSQKQVDFLAWVFAVIVMLTSLAASFFVGRDMVDLPPAYHDEYSYVFQAKTLLMGAFSVPSDAKHPELFDQMHVLNEGRMASRYYPGTGLWLAPWIAIGYPYWGYWLASSLTSFFVFWTGYELGRLRSAMISGFACALSPGIAIFANLLLAHQPTLLGLAVFIWAFVKWQRTQSRRNLFVAGCGLSFAMLCRPATAAAVGFPFGATFLIWLMFVRNTAAASAWKTRIRSLIVLGLPLVAGWTVMLSYHRDITGSWTTSPYQLYTDIYSPSHVYGFNNVNRGQKKIGPKVNLAYDRWALNLTPTLAVSNVRDRWLASWLWTFDVMVLAMTSVIVIGTIRRWDSRWACVGFAILSLHAMHIPYWYTGIMGWHYVFESAPLWCLMLGLATDLLFRDWQASGRWLMPGWWILLLTVSLAGAYLPIRLPGLEFTPRTVKAIRSISHPRKNYAEFNDWMENKVKDRPALVLIVTDPDNQHVDYVVNSPNLNDDILRARYLSGTTNANAIAGDYPARHTYLCDPKKKFIERIR